jgi:GPH family glycoside/pentoside/hexuronide:cation symporter
MNSRVTLERDRVSMGARLAYGVGAFVNNLLAAAMGGMAIVLNLGLGMNPAWVGWLGALPRLTDALTDPLMGYISDNSKTRWGRRRPFIFVGAIAAAGTFVLLWQVPADASSEMQFYWFLGFSIVFYLAYTCFATPWVALGYELTPDYHERTRLMGVQNFVGQLAYVIAPWFLWVMQHNLWRGDMIAGARGLAVAVAVVTVLLGVLPAVLLRERFAAEALVLSELRADKNGPKPGLRESLRDFLSGFSETIRCGPFVLLCTATFLVFNGFILISSFQSYVIIYYVFGGDTVRGGEFVGYSGSLGAISTFVVIAIVTLGATKMGKRHAFFLTTGVSVLGYALKWFCYDPNNPMLLLLPAPLMAFGLGGLFTLMPSMICDVVDYDELQTRRRREGMYGSIFWWVVKLGMAAALALSGYLLNATGFDVALGGNQSEQTIWWLRLFDAAIPAAASLVAIGVVWTYPLTEARAHEVRSALEARRGEGD